ncbi:MAG: PTS fructose-like transporter subunit IIB [Tractidigestivibacter sp.]|jgi:fructose-specific PTS system IIB-like component|uniref:PTS fructose-like transporter subunit IIB n=1 Tax=Tractidigestivibacter sp. TaxID=2847320 RepID=UPI003D93A79B
MEFVAVTACPSGVAHTYMAAQGLKDAAKKYGCGIHVETQGSLGVENELTPEEIAAADAVILTNDIGIKGEERFAGKPIVRVGTEACISKGGSIIKTLIAKLG